MTIGLYHQIDVDTAEGFLDFFVAHRQSQVLWGRADEDHWMFRGMRSAGWTLVPSAFRLDEAGNSAFVRFTRAQVTRGHFETIQEQIGAEHACVIRFANWVSESGFEVPGDRPELRSQELPTLLPHPGDGRDFPAFHFRWVYALAQHHGIPTRLLDWTMAPLTAVYFAAREAAENISSGETPSAERIAVWALSRKFVDDFAREWDPGPEVITVPTVSNRNLHAQRGLFTLVRYHRNSPGPFTPRPPSIDELFKQHERPATLEGLPRNEPFLFKFTVPAAESRKLLFYLRRSGVHHASIYPGLHSIKGVMLEEAFLERPPQSTVPTQSKKSEE
jgi:FRG domain-containing protein